MKYIKKIIKYAICFVIIVGILFSSLIIAAKIPKDLIKQNLKESLPFFKENLGIKQLYSRREYSYLHLYADSVLLNIIYCIDSDNSIESVLWSNQFKEVHADINNDFIKVVEEDKEPNSEYLRYWHGSIVVMRPLLVFFNIEQIYLFNQIAMWGIAILLLLLILKRSRKIAMMFFVSMIMVAFPIVPLCLEYSWTFYIMMIASIIAILIEKKGDKGLNILFFVTGILTCFFDFLTTELITILVPVLLVLYIRKEENRLLSFKDSIRFLIKACTIWAIAYVLMWLAKWFLASVILKIDAIQYVKEKAVLRINGLNYQKTHTDMCLDAIFQNWHNLYPINIIKNKNDLLKIVIVFTMVLIFIIDWKNLKSQWFSGIMLMIAIIPYIRYLILSNHSCNHAFFTFRSQIITIMCIGLILIDCFNYNLWCKKVNLVRRKNK